MEQQCLPTLRQQGSGGNFMGWLIWSMSPCGLQEEKEVLKSMKSDSQKFSEGATVSTPTGSAVVDKRGHQFSKSSFQASMCPSQLEVQ
ncbi:hypothetical protein DPX16_19178 [Anabarilius grahami]|uniref:Uncharacterized protein n=1 Tax=Anabarilius grahami TaxID=495550 RepID=A0A3N0YZD6_ANAGA|nr:hypothetical protein DPX16_19178 [Anabarilius grahami]